MLYINYKLTRFPEMTLNIQHSILLLHFPVQINQKPKSLTADIVNFIIATVLSDSTERNRTFSSMFPVKKFTY